MKRKAVFFDLDDTLYSGFPEGDAEGFIRCGQYAAANCGVSAEDFTARIRQAREDLKVVLPREPEIHDRTLVAQQALEAFGINPIPHAEAMHDLYWSAVFDHMIVRPGAADVLTELRERGVKVGVCTNMLVGIQMRKLCRLGLADKVDFLVTSEEAGRDMPDSPIFELALKKAGCTPAEALMVGDNFTHDIIGAHRVGIDGLWLHVHDEPSVTADFPFLEAADFYQAADLIRSALDN